jgi:hypothetical protein
MGELTLFKNGNNLPAHLRRGALSDTTRSLMGGSNNKRISIEGGVFRMIVGGQEVAVNEDRAMNIIVIRAAEHNSRTYYEGTYVKGAKVRPACWSNDSVKPHPDVKTPQSPTCATCPQNIKGSGTSDTRACRFQRRLAVALENDVNGDIYALSVPAASVFSNGEGNKMGLQQYARFLGGHGIDVNAVVTEMRFDTNATAPKLTFSAIRPLEENEYETVKLRQDDPACTDAVTLTVADLDGGEDKPAAPAEAPAKPAGKPVPKAAAAALAPAKVDAPEPVVRDNAKPSLPSVDSILKDWGADDDE